MTIVGCLGLHSLLKSRRFTVNLSFVPYKRGFLTVNLQVSRGLQILREWRLPPTRAIGWTEQVDLEKLLLSLEAEGQDQDQDDEVDLDIERQMLE